MNAQKILELFLANLPLIIGVLGGIGLLGGLAAFGRAKFREAKAAAAKTKTKLDDALVAVAERPFMDLMDLIERGDIEGAKRKVGVVTASIEKAKAGQLPSINGARPR